MPYEVLAGVEPCDRGWVVVSGNLQGTHLSPRPPQVFERFVDLIDWKPAFQIIAVHAPLGLPTAPAPGGRRCDHAARRLLGPHRGGAIASAPCRAALAADTLEAARRVNGTLSTSVWHHVEQFRQVAAEIAPYWQRTIFEVHPELSFLGLNGDEPLRHGRRTPEGAAERRALLEARLPDIGAVLDTHVPGATRRQVLDASANLWTARRIRSHAAIRIPDMPEWDDNGIRLEMWR